MTRLLPTDSWSQRSRRDRGGGLWWAPFVVVLLGAGLAWLVVHKRGGTGADVSAAIAVSVALAGLLDGVLYRRRMERAGPPTPERLTSELLEQWRVGLLAAITKTRVGEGGQLATMVRQGDPVDVKVARVDHDSGRPRVRVGGRLLAWSEITRRWDTSHGRLVILESPATARRLQRCRWSST